MNVDGAISPLANARAHRSEDVVSAQQQLVIEATVAKSSSTGTAGHGASNTNGNANCVSTCIVYLIKKRPHCTVQ